jgi:hypothetical protein
METQNISAQLFVKQLPQAQLASFDGAKTDYNTNYLNTSVNYPDSDKNIEEAFQKQLDLSDYYKSSQVFDTMKKIFDTNEGTFNTTSEILPDKDLKKNSFNKPIMPVGPRDTVFEKVDSLVNKAKEYSKESFGNVNKNSKESFGNVNKNSKESFGNVNKNSKESFGFFSMFDNIFGKWCYCIIIILVILLFL